MEIDDSVSDDAALKKAISVLKTAGIKIDKNNETGALLMLSRGQIDKVAQYSLSNGDNLDKKE